MDKGSNAQDSLERIDKSPYHFIGSLVLDIPKRDLLALDKQELPRGWKVFGLVCN